MTEQKKASGLRDISEDEWHAYEWIEVRTFGDTEPVFARGLKHAPERPWDGFHYVKIVDPARCEYRWVRAKTWAP